MGDGGRAPGPHRAGGDAAPARSSARSWPRSARWRRAWPTRSATRWAGSRWPPTSCPRASWTRGPLSQEMARAILAGIGGDRGHHQQPARLHARHAAGAQRSTRLLRILDPVVESAAAEVAARGVTVGYGRARCGPWSCAATVRSSARSSPTCCKNALEAIDPRTRRRAGRWWISVAERRPRGWSRWSTPGVGIGAEDRDRIFLPFFTTKPSGTGLGMSIVKKIVDLHGGDIVGREHARTRHPRAASRCRPAARPPHSRREATS